MRTAARRPASPSKIFGLVKMLVGILLMSSLVRAFGSCPSYSTSDITITNFVCTPSALALPYYKTHVATYVKQLQRHLKPVEPIVSSVAKTWTDVVYRPLVVPGAIFAQTQTRKAWVAFSNLEHVVLAKETVGLWIEQNRQHVEPVIVWTRDKWTLVKPTLTVAFNKCVQVTGITYNIVEPRIIFAKDTVVKGWTQAVVPTFKNQVLPGATLLASQAQSYGLVLVDKVERAFGQAAAMVLDLFTEQAVEVLVN